MECLLSWWYLLLAVDLSAGLGIYKRRQAFTVLNYTDHMGKVIECDVKAPRVIQLWHKYYISHAGAIRKTIVAVVRCQHLFNGLKAALHPLLHPLLQVYVIQCVLLAQVIAN